MWQIILSFILIMNSQFIMFLIFLKALKPLHYYVSSIFSIESHYFHHNCMKYHFFYLLKHYEMFYLINLLISLNFNRLIVL